MSTAWTERLPKNMVAMLERGERARFNRDMRLPMLIPSLARNLRFTTGAHGGHVRRVLVHV